MNTDLLLTSNNGKKYQVKINEKGELYTEYSNYPSLTNEQIIDEFSDSMFYDEITYEELRDEVSGTDYYIVRIPHKDKHGNIIKLRHGFANDTFGYKDENGKAGETALSFSKRHNASFVSNASIWDLSDEIMLGYQIKDGEIQHPTRLRDRRGDPTTCCLGITSDNEFKVYDYMKLIDELLPEDKLPADVDNPPLEPAYKMIQDGCLDVYTAFYPLYTNGIPLSDSEIDDINYDTNTKGCHPRNVIARLNDKDIIFLTCDGRSVNNNGMNFKDMIRILEPYNVDVAYNLDGGGSTQTIVKGININKAIDGKGKIHRKVGDFIYVAKESNMKTGKCLMNDITDFNKSLQDLFRDIMDLSTSNDIGNFYDFATLISDCNDIINGGIYVTNNKTANMPNKNCDWVIIHIQIGTSSSMQIAIPINSKNEKKKIRKYGKILETFYWDNWREV